MLKLILARERRVFRRHERANACFGRSGTKDQPILGDPSIYSGACIGPQCVKGTSRDVDTLRLQEHNLKLAFQDSGSSAGSPSGNWQITVESRAKRFPSTDIDGARKPSDIEAVSRTVGARLCSTPISHSSRAKHTPHSCDPTASRPGRDRRSGCPEQSHVEKNTIFKKGK